MLGTGKTIEVELVGWGGEAMSETDAMEVVGGYGSSGFRVRHVDPEVGLYAALIP
jgi:hypothetical protein